MTENQKNIAIEHLLTEQFYATVVQLLVKAADISQPQLDIIQKLARPQLTAEQANSLFDSVYNQDAKEKRETLTKDNKDNK